MIYAGIGSRETPHEIIGLMEAIGERKARLGWVLRSGAAPGADMAFERGCDRYKGYKEIYLPWNGFQGRTADGKSTHVIMSQSASDLAALLHPNWQACSQGARRLHARNCHQVMGQDLLTRATKVVCWTRNGEGKGGTGQAIRLAQKLNIPVHDLGNDEILRLYRAWLGVP